MHEHIVAVRQALADLAHVAQHLHTPLDTSAVDRALDALEASAPKRK